jgi:hypothetical protein
MTVEILYFEGCPHAAATVAMVRRCLARLVLEVAVVERVGNFPSPTVRVDGRDVMGDPPAADRSCRLDIPDEGDFLDALRVGARRRAR